MSHFPIFIPGHPIPQGSKNATVRAGRAVMYEANPKHKNWRAVMATHLRQWTGTWFGTWDPLDGPLVVDATFWIPKPKRPKFELPATPADLDKYQRALGDAMQQSGLIREDSRITTWHARKRYAGPDGPGITIHDITPDTLEQEHAPWPASGR